MANLLRALLGLLAASAGATAIALVLGAGVIRQGGPVWVAAGAGALVILPALGLAAAGQRLKLGLSASVLLWAVLLLAGFPLYFPGERAQSLRTGLAVLSYPFGLSVSPGVGERLDALLPAGPTARVPPVFAAPIEPPPVPSEGLVASQDQVVLPMEGDGRTLTLPATFEGPKGEVEVEMLFDTGATLTTLDRVTLERLGVDVPADAPKVTVRTAAGERVTQLVLLDRVWVAGLAAEGVTVSVCDACFGDETAGLLGLNITGHFLATLDPARRELTLIPHGPPNRALDVAPWLNLEAGATRWPDGRVEVEIKAKNRSRRHIERADVAIRCGPGYLATVGDLDPGETGTALVSLPAGTDCAGYTIGLERASW